MVAKVQVDPAVLLEVYERTGSLRSAGRELGLGHMVVKAALLRMGVDPRDRRMPAEEAMSPTSRIYLKPAAIEQIDILAQKAGLGRHEYGRILMDRALELHAKGLLFE